MGGTYQWVILVVPNWIVSGWYHLFVPWYQETERYRAQSG
jgi:hypothetical protein